MTGWQFEHVDYEMRMLDLYEPPVDSCSLRAKIALVVQFIIPDVTPPRGRAIARALLECCWRVMFG